MGANFSLELVQSVGAFVVLCIGYLKGLLLPDERGASAFLPKLTDQLEELDRQKAIDGEEFPGSSLSFSSTERSNWMTKIHEARRPIGQILWPGTHYSATNKIGIPLITRPYGQRQTMSIIDQLVNGIRALDIRIQQDRRVCCGNMLCDTTISDVISDIKQFLNKTKFEIIILELQTERGFCDPENFEDYLVKNFGDLLIHQDDQVFFKSITEVLPGRIICIWKPILNAFMPRQGGPIWSGKYLQCDEFDTQMPLTRFDGNIHNLEGRSAALKINNYFYKVENTLNPQTSTTLESLLVWPKYANVVSKRINGFSRLFLAKCYSDGTLSRLQVYAVDFVNDDFISACIGLNQESSTTQVSVFSDESSKINQTIDQAAQLAALAEPKRREVEMESRAMIEKAMQEMRAEAVETKAAGEMKLTEARTMVVDAQKKLAEAQAKLQEVEVKENEMDILRVEIEKERSALNEEKSKLNITLASLSSKEEVSVFSESSEINQTIDQVAHLAALAESKRREDNLKNALEDEKECRATIEKVMHEMRAEAAETKVAGEMKLTEAHTTVENAQKKLAEAQAKFQEVEAREDNLKNALEVEKKCRAKIEKAMHEMRAEAAATKVAGEMKQREVQSMVEDAQKKLGEARAKFQAVEAREDDLRRRTISYESECDKKENEMDTLRAEIDKERSALNEEKFKLNITLASLSTKEEELSRLVEIRSNDDNNMNINSSSSNEVNEVVATWEFSKFSWIPPDNLKISHIEDDKCWKWECGDAHLLQVNSLNVRGNYKIDDELLHQGVRYEVVYWVKMLDSAFGWESPLHVRLTFPDGRIQNNQIILDTTPTDNLHISVGNLVTPLKGEIKFSLEQLDNTLKGGIVIHGVFIQPSFVDLVIPKELSIKFHGVRECWKWSDSYSRFAKRRIEYAELISVRDLKVDGIFETEKLVFGCTYKVGFMILFKSTAAGWENPTKLTLRLPNGSLQQRRASFNGMRYKTILIYAGEFKMMPEMVGKLEFSMENNNEVEKTGIYILLAFIQQQH